MLNAYYALENLLQAETSVKSDTSISAAIFCGYWSFSLLVFGLKKQYIQFDSNQVYKRSNLLRLLVFGLLVFGLKKQYIQFVHQFSFSP